jgi:hypothetical protein
VCGERGGLTQRLVALLHPLRIHLNLPALPCHGRACLPSDLFRGSRPSIHQLAPGLAERWILGTSPRMTECAAYESPYFNAALLFFIFSASTYTSPPSSPRLHVHRGGAYPRDLGPCL